MWGKKDIFAEDYVKTLKTINITSDRICHDCEHLIFKEDKKKGKWKTLQESE